ncbi:MAG: 4Fe-4S binding protein [Desulfobacter sp.]|nr:4Fe-4S binding protein [Desulfobacter sp.]WDP87365.1 MAG: 4Fe-4S binding protein [Desulfobacter sp.]
MKKFKHYGAVATLVLNPDQCIGCALCTQVCPHQVFEMTDRSARISDLDACMECGACVTNCPTNALGVTPGVG